MISRSFALFSVATFLTLSAFAGGGSLEGGGGLGEDLISYEAFVVETGEIVANLPEIFRALEAANEVPAELRAKLFDGEDSVLAALSKAKVRFPFHGPCYDPAGRPVPASALIKSGERTLCFSHELLSVRIERPKFFRRMTAIAAHEASHLAPGVTEADARVVEHLVQLRLSPF